MIAYLEGHILRSEANLIVLKTSANRMKSVDVFVKGPGSGRESALRAISAIEDMRIASMGRAAKYNY